MPVKGEGLRELILHRSAERGPVSALQHYTPQCARDDFICSPFGFPRRNRVLMLRGLFGLWAEALGDVGFDNVFEFGGDVGAAESHGLFAVDEDGRCWLFAGAGQ